MGSQAGMGRRAERRGSWPSRHTLPDRATQQEPESQLDLEQTEVSGVAADHLARW